VDERGAARIGGQVTNPGGTERLHEYWVHGKGAAKIRWGEGGDYDRCVTHLSKYVRDAHGLCANLHHDALGIWPATHAAMEHKAGRAAMSMPMDGPDADGLDGSWDDCTGLPDLTGIEVHHIEAAAGHSEPAPASRAAKLGSGARFRALKGALAAKGARDPGALAAHIGMKKYGKAKFMSLAAKARGGAKRSGDAPPQRLEYMRLYPLEDIRIIRSADGGDGRTVEAYAAVFDDPAEIHDHEGHYVETIDRAAFNKVIADASRARGGFPGSVKVLYNHGMTIQGTPSERFSMPIGVPVDIRAESRGVLTRTRYNETPLAEEILENIRAGSITSQSFTGRIVRSDPSLRRGDRYRPASDGSLRTVCRMELGLREYGPVLWPAYSGAEILGVRMSTPGTWEPDEHDEHDEQALHPDGEAAPGEPLAPEGEHSARYHQHALYVLRAKEQRERAGLVW
jgi:HK97 family phage prohead protease